jgi:hypothetical protein
VAKLKGEFAPVAAALQGVCRTGEAHINDDAGTSIAKKIR